MTTTDHQKYLEHVFGAIQRGEEIAADHLVYAVGVGAANAKSDPTADDILGLRIAVLALGGASYTDILREVANAIDSSADPAGAPLSSDPFGLLSTPPPAMPGAAAAPSPAPAPTPEPPAEPVSTTEPPADPPTETRRGRRGRGERNKPAK